MIEEGGAAFVHIDVMDGHFVPNLTMGVPLLKQLKPATSLLCDVHLAIDNPLDEAAWFIDAKRRPSERARGGAGPRNRP